MPNQPRRLDNEKRYQYTLIDTHYQADNFAKGRAFKKFFDEFCKNVFEINLAMFEDIGEFPIAYNENNAYASIGAALHTLTPYAWSEAQINYKDKKHKNDTENSAKTDEKEKWRFVDFWCMNANKEFEVWIEAKRLWLNIGKNAQGQFDSIACERIKNALWQIDNIKKAKPYQIAKDTNFKVALFAIPLSCAASQMPDDKDIKQAPKAVADLLAEFIDNRRNMGVLCAVLNLDAQGKKEVETIYLNDFTPYFALAAVVLE